MKIRIKSSTESFRRAGIEATREGVIVDTDDLTEAQIEALRHERMLSITPVMPGELAGDANGNGQGDGQGDGNGDGQDDGNDNDQGDVDGQGAGSAPADAQAKPKAAKKAKAGRA